MRIREILQARNELYVENAVTEDDLYRICYNKQVELREQKDQEKNNRRKPKEISYLSKQDRDSLIVLSAITQTLNNLIESWGRLGNRPPLVMKGLRTALTMCYKAIEWQMKGISEKDYKYI